MTGIAALIPQLHVDSISIPAFYRLLETINESAEMREACINLGYFANDLPEAQRKERFKYCFETLLTAMHPPVALSYRGLHPLKPEFISTFLRPPLIGLWTDHVDIEPAARKERRRPSYITVSNELEERVRALEAVWLVRGYAV